MPLQFVRNLPTVQDLFNLVADIAVIQRRRIANIKDRLEPTGNDIVAADAGVNIDKLQGSRRKVFFVVMIPMLQTQIVQGTGEGMNGVVGLIRVGHMSLFP